MTRGVSATVAFCVAAWMSSKAVADDSFDNTAKTLYGAPQGVNQAQQQVDKPASVIHDYVGQKFDQWKKETWPENRGSTSGSNGGSNIAK
jgi:hypothetical protein